MNAKPVEKQFARMGARIKITKPEPPRNRRWWREPSDYSLDVQEDRHGEKFVLTIPAVLEKELELGVLQSRPDAKHLLLMARKNDGVIDRFLCGHDEREWFVAAVPGAVSTVADAMESLKPNEVHVAQARAGLNGKTRNRRKNKAFRRQGEWFFVPVENQSVVNDESTLFWEPIARSGGKPHMVEFLVREDGETVYMCREYPRPLRKRAYKALLRANPKARKWNWEVRRMNARVYARGRIRHPDHNTVTLHGWHEVLMNTENQSRTMSNVAFID